MCLKLGRVQLERVLLARWNRTADDLWTMIAGISGMDIYIDDNPD